MNLPSNFISGTTKYSTKDTYVPAPYIRKNFFVGKDLKSAKILIGCLGFYEIFINGHKITKGYIAPYISNPDHLIYFDEYDICKYLNEGENAFGVVLGNGMQNAFGGSVWDFDKAKWRSSPAVSISLEIEDYNGNIHLIESDENFKTHPSPILMDDLRLGEIYDATKEIPNWNMPGFNDDSWDNCIIAAIPRGDKKICESEPIIKMGELKPISITPINDGYVYDFGENNSGLCTLNITAKSGTVVTMIFGELLKDGELYVKNIQFKDEDYTQKATYTCKEGVQSYTPTFTYFGFRYVFVTGITKEQATNELLTYNILYTKLNEVGNFSCSCEILNKLQEITRRSTTSNFFYFPNDCPHREKNGWTADAALSAEHTLLNLTPEKSYREWLCSIRKALNDEGGLPGIVPTGGWGYHWGNGPAWDCVLVYLPYFTYMYRGDKKILNENSFAIFRYLNFIDSKINENGLISFGLGDWCQPNRQSDKFVAPVEFTDTVIAMDVCKKAAEIYQVLNKTIQYDFAISLYNKLKKAARVKLINGDHAIGNCQTTQAMALFYGLFEKTEKPFEILVKMIEDADYHIDTGVIGGRVIFHTLADHNRADIAYKMITNKTFPSYKHWLDCGATTLWEDFLPDGGQIHSHNHHFWGDISGWFIKHIAGINVNYFTKTVEIKPNFIDGISWASAYHKTPNGIIKVRWEMVNGKVNIVKEIPEFFNK